MQKDEDTITIHLGMVLSKERYNEVLESVKTFMELRWPDFSQSRFSN